MKIYLTGLLILLSLGANAQVADFLPTQKTISKPFSLPIKVDLDGNMEFVTGDRDLVFAPGIQVGFDKSVVQYSLPEMAGEFSLMPPRESSGWMEYKRKRYDYGIGLVAIMQKAFRLGLAPYKGAKFTMRRLKTHKDALTSDKLSFPKELAEMNGWAVGDEGTYQTYGGIQVYGGMDVSIVNVGTATFGWQNQFIISILRSDEGIKLSVTEEKLNRRSLHMGVEPANLTWTHFKGKQLRAEFDLDFSNPEHHELYKSALKGELTTLEEKLPAERRNIRWEGTDFSYYWGIPWLIGETNSRGSYEVSEDKQDYFLEVLQKKNSGLLVSTTWQQRFVYHNAESILLMWTTDMKKASPKKLRAHFFGPAKAVGFRGFDMVLDEKNYGTVIGEVGVVLTKNEVMSFANIDVATVESRLRVRCEEIKDSCARAEKRAGIMKRYVKASQGEWENRRKELGILFVKYPALLHSLLKETRIVKDAYFKFLSDRYQSLEGLTVLAL